MQALAPDKSGVDFVPVPNARLAELPAEEDVAPIDLAGEIHESRSHPLADDAQGGELGNITFDVLGEPLRFDLKQLGDRVGTVGTCADGRELEFANLVLPHAMFAHEILDDPADQGQRA